MNQDEIAAMQRCTRAELETWLQQLHYENCGLRRDLTKTYKTLRDEFAVAALSGIGHRALDRAPIISSWCYAVADAMLKERLL